MQSKTFVRTARGHRLGRQFNDFLCNLLSGILETPVHRVSQKCVDRRHIQHSTTGVSAVAFIARVSEYSVLHRPPPASGLAFCLIMEELTLRHSFGVATESTFDALFH
jgi:hypothetical protein